MKKKIYILLVLVLTCSLLFGCKPQVEEIREIKSLVLTTETTITQKGAFIIAVGTFSSEEEINKYYYLFIKGQEGFRLQKISSNNIEIVETDDVSPQIKGYFYYNGEIKDWTNYIVYVPIGTIFVNYDVNMFSENKQIENVE